MRVSALKIKVVSPVIILNVQLKFWIKDDCRRSSMVTFALKYVLLEPENVYILVIRIQLNLEP